MTETDLIIVVYWISLTAVLSIIPWCIYICEKKHKRQNEELGRIYSSINETEDFHTGGIVESQSVIPPIVFSGPQMLSPDYTLGTQMFCASSSFGIDNQFRVITPFTNPQPIDIVAEPKIEVSSLTKPNTERLNRKIDKQGGC